MMGNDEPTVVRRRGRPKGSTVQPQRAAAPRRAYMVWRPGPDGKPEVLVVSNSAETVVEYVIDNANCNIEVF
jgi:hypothetical protein